AGRTRVPREGSRSDFFASHPRARTREREGDRREGERENQRDGRDEPQHDDRRGERERRAGGGLEERRELAGARDEVTADRKSREEARDEERDGTCRRDVALVDDGEVYVAHVAEHDRRGH